MSREWQPGDVALVEAGCWANRKVALRLDEGWSHLNGVNMDGDGVVTPVRRLVVIDPEDREQIERLWRIWATIAPDHRLAQDCMQAALREFADPKPPRCTASLSVFDENQSVGHECRESAGHDGPHVAAGASWTEASS